MHWKTINYLTDNYSNIVIGNMSTKGIVSSNKLNKNIKRIAMHMRLFVFKQRLQYKCKLKNIGYKEIDEAYTSKTCTNCGYKNDNIGGKEIFTCGLCKYSIDRDVNGARNIMLKQINTYQIKRKKINNQHNKICKKINTNIQIIKTLTQSIK